MNAPRRTVPLLATLLVSATPLVSACPPSDQGLLAPAVAPVRIVGDFAAGPNDAFEVSGHRVDGDILRIEVRYSGGCETHAFLGQVGASIAESLPVQMWGRVAHDDRDDPCDSIVSDMISFDLSPIRELYQNSYGSGSATVILHMAPLLEAVNYSF